MATRSRSKEANPLSQACPSTASSAQRAGTAYRPCSLNSSFINFAARAFAPFRPSATACGFFFPISGALSLRKPVGRATSTTLSLCPPRIPEIRDSGFWQRWAISQLCAFPLRVGRVSERYRDVSPTIVPRHANLSAFIDLPHP